MQLITNLGQILSQNEALLLSLAAILGLLIGSFLNVVILRQPERMFYHWRQQCQQLLAENRNEENPPEPARDDVPPGIVRQRSFCTNCKHQLSALDNIPVFSYLILRGRCRYCKEKISSRYPIVELLTSLASCIVIWHFGFTVTATYGLLLTWTLIVLSGIDIDHQLLPDDIVLPLLWLGLLFSLTGSTVTPTSSIIGAITGYLILWSIYQFFKLLTGKEGMGYGDFKLLAALGAGLGWQMLPLTILLASLTGAIIGSIILILKRKDNRAIPFGPYLAFAGFVALIWGHDITTAYLKYLNI